MSRIVVLDAGPLWLAASARGKPLADRCRAWLRAMLGGGAEVSLPEVADFEVRREFLRRGATTGIRRLDGLKSTLDYRPITTTAMLRAAEFWALLRRGGIPTAGDEGFDADAILAGQADLLGQPGDVVTIATTNVRHLGRFPGIDAQLWETIK